MFACCRALARGRCGRGCKSRVRDRDDDRGCGRGHDERARSFGGCLLPSGCFAGYCSRRQKILAFGALALLGRCDCGCMSRAGVHGRGVHAYAHVYAHIVDAHLLWLVCAHGCCNHKKMLHMRYLRFGNCKPLCSLPNVPGKALPYAGVHRVCSLQNRVGLIISRHGCALMCPYCHTPKDLWQHWKPCSNYNVKHLNKEIVV